jgi:hypothetical protein
VIYSCRSQYSKVPFGDSERIAKRANLSDAYIAIEFEILNLEINLDSMELHSNQESRFSDLI